ncbi:phage tail protein, partial [Klebsiella sp. Acro-834]|nr:phage tail protein [Klebsiella sp. Acro-834]
WRWDGVMPKVVLPGSTPATAGGTGKGKWIDVTDATLRANLGSSEHGEGAYLVAWARNYSCEVAASVAVFMSAQKINLWEY